MHILRVEHRLLLQWGGGRSACHDPIGARRVTYEVVLASGSLAIEHVTRNAAGIQFPARI